MLDSLGMVSCLGQDTVLHFSNVLLTWLMILKSKPLAFDPIHTYLILSMQYIPLDSKISR